MDKDNLIQKLNQAQIIIAECLTDLGGKEVVRPIKGDPKVGEDSEAEVDFSKPFRPFVKKYAKGKSGPKKFVLLVAYLTKGDVSQSISLNDVETQWKKMKSLLGSDFNRFYSSQAKDRDWVDSPKQGFYILRPNWKDVLN